MADPTTVTLHCRPDDKLRWLNSARVAGQPFAEWARDALEAASVDTSPPWAQGLSERATICLLGAGFDSRESVVQAVAEGRDDELIAISNFGRKCLAEVKQWLCVG